MTTPVILAVTATPPDGLLIEWSSGEILLIEIGAQIECFASLHVLRDGERFAQAKPGVNGRGVSWGDGAEISADLLYWLGKEQMGSQRAPAPPTWAGQRAALTLTIAAEYRRTGMIEASARQWVPCVTEPLATYIKALCEPAGRPMHADIARLLVDLLHGQVKPARRQPVSDTAIREIYRQKEAQRAALNQIEQGVYARAGTLKKTVAADMSLAFNEEGFELSPTRIEEIAAGKKPRKSRK